MGNSAKVGLVGILALIVLVVAIWDRHNEGTKRKVIPATKKSLAEIRTLSARPTPTERTRASRRSPTERIQKVPAREETRMEGSFQKEFAVKSSLVKPVGGKARISEKPCGTKTKAESRPAEVARKPEETPPPPPAPKRTPERPKGKRYTIQPGDTLSRIARKAYGVEGKWRFIYEANRKVIARSECLPIGREIIIPPMPKAPKRAEPTTPPPPSNGRMYTVKPGDTLAGISENFYGKSGGWKRIAEANKITDVDRIRVGQRLVIPAAAGTTGGARAQ